jgi:hypothetical protein
VQTRPRGRTSIGSRLTGSTDEACKSNRLPAQREANELQLGEKHVQVRELCVARAGQVSSRDVDDVLWIAEVCGAHVFRIGIRA